MIARRISAALLASLLAACAAPTAPVAKVPAPLFANVDLGYTAYVDGSSTDAVISTHSGGAYLGGGGTDIDAGMVWLMAQGGTRSPGKYGDVVVLRTTGT